MRAVVCLSIRVPSAFRAPQEKKIKIVHDSIGYGLFQNLGRLDLNRKASGWCGLVFASVSLFWHLCNTGRYIRIVTGLLSMQLIGLTEQCNVSFSY